MFDNIGSHQDDDAPGRAAIAVLAVAALMSTLSCVGVLSSLLLWPQGPPISQVRVVDLGWEDLVEIEEELGVLPPPAAKLGGPPSVVQVPIDKPAPQVAAVEPLLPLLDLLRDATTLAVAGPGVPDGDPDGRLDGVPTGVVCGAPGQPCGEVTSLSRAGTVVRLHHTQVKVRRKVQPIFPRLAIDAEVQSARCIARVTIDPRGRPERVVLSDCPEIFRASARAALRGWRWYPARDANKKPVRAEFRININYRLR